MEETFNIILDQIREVSLDDTEEHVRVCPACSEKDTEELDDSGIPTCRECGFVFDTKPLSNEAESKGNIDKISRCTGPKVNENLRSANHGSYIVKTAKMSVRTYKKLQTLSTWMFMDSHDRRCSTVHTLINNTCNRYGLGANISYRACHLYNTILSSVGVTRGEPRTAIIASCVYHACIELGVPRTHEEITEIFKVSHAMLCKKITEVNLALNSSCDTYINPSMFVYRMSDGAGLSKKHSDLCYDAVCRLDAFLEEKKVPLLKTVNSGIVVASAIYIVEAYTTGIPPVKKRYDKIAEACNVSWVSMNKFIPKIQPLFTKVLDKIIQSQSA